jgi:transcriptional regulator GlxA family with amidase domain
MGHPRATTRTIGLIGYPGANDLDITGPAYAMAAANSLVGGTPAYAVLLLSPDGAAFCTESRLTIMADAALRDAPALDTIIIPGGAALRLEPTLLRTLADWIAERAPTTRRLVAVCTGFYALAASGQLDGRRGATHWRYAADAARRFPSVQIDPDAIFVRDGPCSTSAGVTAGIDLTLALIEEDLGASIALGVARDLVVYMKRPGGQLQYSEPLRFQVRAKGRLADLAAWIPSHLGGDLSVEALAARVSYSGRHFQRLFKATFGVTPADYVEGLRLDEAVDRLLNSSLTLDAVAHSLGYASDAAFRRAFERRFGIVPSAYRQRFGRQTPRR